MEQLEFVTLPEAEATAWADADLEEQIMRERNKEIQLIEEDMLHLNDIFRDLAVLVVGQGEQLEVAAEHVEEAATATEEGVQHLEQAELHAARARRRGMLLKGALVFSGITVGGIGLTVLSPVAGLLTAGAGITGIVTTIGIALKKNK